MSRGALSMDIATKYRRILIGIVVLGCLLWAAGKLAVLYADYLWFDSLGYTSVFTTELWAKVWLGAAAFLVTGLWLGGNTYLAARLSPGRYLEIKGLPWVIPSPRLKRLLAVAGGVAIVLVAYGFAKAAVDLWYPVLQFLNREAFAWRDPVLGYDAGFYVFVLPMLGAIKNYVFLMAVLGLGGAAGAYFVGGAIGWPYARMTRSSVVHLAALAALLLAAVAFGYWLDRFDLLFSSRGAVFGAGYVDAHVRMIAYGLMAAVSLATAAAVLVAGLAARRKVGYVAVGVLAVCHVATVVSYPAVVQRFDVEPNELVREMPYLENNIKATRFAYNLADVEVKPYPAIGTLTLADVRRDQGTFESIRLWDWRVLLATYNQIESLRPYYHFNDVDVDRYAVDGRYRQVTLAVRELEPSLLNPDSRTWVNLHLLYTHGYGLCVSPVNAVTPEGLPELWIRNIPPQSRVDLQAPQPAIYFGELTHTYVFVRTTQKEFDYPLGDENRYAEYAGVAGVPANSLSRQLLFAYYFGDWNILLTDSFTADTRVLWARQVRQRVRRLAPMLEFDHDPYPVIHEGRLVWIIDGYTRTDLFPYSARVGGSAGGANYIRNAVKAVVDAYDGRVTFYVADPDDALIRVAGRIFPALFRDLAQMPPALRAHLRYPNDLFEIQAEQYLAYHMTDPRIFYNKEDLWQRPNHVYEGHTQPIQAYYFIMTVPGQPQPEYILMLPFTPAGKDNMVGWLAGRCDGKEYGKLLCYTFPKDHLVFGPNQIEARINQNDQISPLLTLWNQHGSRVVRGNLIVIPAGDSIFYVEPLYLKSENAAIPELKRVIVAYQDRVAMKNTLDEALAEVFGESPPAGKPLPAKPSETPAPPSPATGPLGARALELFEKAQKQIRDGDWAGYGATMQELGKVLREMTGPPPKQ